MVASVIIFVICMICLYAAENGNKTNNGTKAVINCFISADVSIVMGVFAAPLLQDVSQESTASVLKTSTYEEMTKTVFEMEKSLEEAADFEDL